MNNKGFLNPDVLRLPMFWIIVFIGCGASTAGYLWAKSSGWASPISNYLIFIFGIFFATWYFLRNDV